MDKLKAAVVGGGIFGSHHINAYKNCKYTVLTSICDINEELARKRAKEYGINYYTDLQKLIDTEKPDIISIATPDPFHYEPSKKAIENGIDILIEKPITINEDEANELISLAKSNNVRVAVDFHKRWDPATINIKLELEKNDSGKVIRGYMSMDDIIDVPINWLKWSKLSSPAHFLGVHCYDSIRFITEKEVKSVFACGQKKVLNSKGIDCYDSVQAMLIMEDNSTWTVDNCWILPNSFPKSNDGKASILCENRFIRVDSQNRGLEIFSSEKSSTPNSYFITYRNGIASGFGIEPIYDFVKCIIEDKPFTADAYDGLKATQIAVAVHKSIETNKVIEL